MTDTHEAIRHFWDVDAHTYDQAGDHHPRSAVELAAWRAAFLRLLPPPPARVLDVGAGTGFLALNLARLGYRVTAVDLAPAMLSALTSKATAAGVELETIEGQAEEPPEGPFDVVVERHLIWTLPDPGSALLAWREVAPEGRLVLFEGLWGQGADMTERALRQARSLVSRVRGDTHGHHGSYDQEMLDALPLASGPDPERLVPLVESTPWGPARIERLHDVDWATRRALPPADQLLGTHPRFAIIAGSTSPSRRS